MPRTVSSPGPKSHGFYGRRGFQEAQAMVKFKDVKTLQKFASVHASIHNHFNQDRHLNRRDTFKQNRATALAKWRQLVA